MRPALGIAYRVTAESLHTGDRVFHNNRPLAVIKAYPETGKVLCRTRKNEKHSRRMLLPAAELTLRPARLLMTHFANATEASECTREEVDFVPRGDPKGPTDAAPGSAEKIVILAARYLDGRELWHPQDRTDYSGLTGDGELHDFDRDEIRRKLGRLGGSSR